MTAERRDELADEFMESDEFPPESMTEDEQAEASTRLARFMRVDFRIVLEVKPTGSLRYFRAEEWLQMTASKNVITTLLDQTEYLWRRKVADAQERVTRIDAVRGPACVRRLAVKLKAKYTRRHNLIKSALEEWRRWLK